MRNHARRPTARRRPSALPKFAAIALVALAGPLSTRSLHAEPERVEVVGAYPIREALRGKVNPRDEAIQKALWEGVSRVALGLIGEEGAPDEVDASAGGPAQPEPTERFRKIFGRQIVPYTRSFRIVEDRGERPVLFVEEPGVRSEYLVVVEVIVDVDRVKGELARAGLIEREVTPGSNRSVLVELVGLERYAGLRVVLDTLRRTLSARQIETLEFGPRRQLLRIEGPYGADEVAARIGRIETAALILDPVEVDGAGQRIRVLAQYLEPLPAGEQEGEAGTSATAAPDAVGPIRP